jgi:serine-type D-Ala-D-Ala endopeptidase (penicillin-binding protein 7)
MTELETPWALIGSNVPIPSCGLKFVCYNADTFRNSKFLKGLPVTQHRLFSSVRLICLLAVMAGFGLPAYLDAQTTVAKPAASPTGSAKKATTKKSTTATAKVKKARAASSRRARVARARAALNARQAREAAEPHFKLTAAGEMVPDLRAEAAIIYNPENGKVLWEENSQNQRSIASITKVMTATVFLEDNPDPTREVIVQRSDVLRASTTHLRAGYKVTVDDLLHLLLIASDNAAARALARISVHGSEGFIDRMNEKAAELGLETTAYADPSGLLSENVSSAYDMAKLIAFVSTDERIASIMRTPEYSFMVGKRRISVHSTNRLVRGGDLDVQAGKTGFIRAAGYCLATLLRLPQTGQKVAVVVLGAKSNAGRFWETRHLFNWLSNKAGDFFTPAVSAATLPATN